MKRTQTKKTFDCLEFKHSAQSEIYEETRGLSRAERAEYFRRRAEEGSLGRWWKSIKQAKAKQGGAE